LRAYNSTSFFHFNFIFRLSFIQIQLQFSAVSADRPDSHAPGHGYIQLQSTDRNPMRPATAIFNFNPQRQPSRRRQSIEPTVNQAASGLRSQFRYTGWILGLYVRRGRRCPFCVPAFDGGFPEVRGFVD
jgi:hypothetical protein